jgi:hypothetical protein
MAKQKTPAAAPAKAAKPKTDDLDELSGLVAQSGQLEAENRDVGGRDLSYINIISKATDPALNTKNPDTLIKGAKIGGFIIPKHKLSLGLTFQATILGMFKIYEDTIPGEPTEAQKKSGQDPMRRIVGMWMPDDAANIEVEGIFDRPYLGRDGKQHILRPAHWVYLAVKGHEDIEDTIITFRSKGNAVYADLQKLVRDAGVTSVTELLVTVSTQQIEAKEYNTAYLYPDFSIAGRNYEFADGKIKILKNGMDKETLAKIIKRSNFMLNEYAGNKMVAKKQNLAGLIAGSAPKQITAGKNASYKDDEEEGVKAAQF